MLDSMNYASEADVNSNYILSDVYSHVYLPFTIVIYFVDKKLGHMQKYFIFNKLLFSLPFICLFVCLLLGLHKYY